MYRRIIVAVILVTIASVSFTAAQDETPQIIFMHHSTGGNLMWQGGLRESLAEWGYELWDHGYNDEGLSDPSGTSLSINWDVPGDNTDPDGWYEIFNQPVTDPPENTFSHMLQYDVIIFKSCFPSSNIDSDERLEDYHRYYLSIRDVMDQHPDKIFIPWTTPPLVPNETTPENAARARQWAAYLISDEYLSGHPNVFVFDIFSLLADEDGFLRAEYRSDEWDSHPNEVANQAAAPVLADLIHTAITTYAPTAAPEVEVQEPEGQVAEPEILEPEASNRIEDFESTDFADRWWMYADVGDAAQVCTLGEPPFSGTYALQLTIDLPAEKYAGCGISFDEPQDRSQMDGVAFFWFSNDPGLLVGISVWVYDPTDPENPTPFYTERRTPTSEWTAVIFGWDELTRAEWVGETGVMEFDPSQIIGVSFDAGHWEEPQKGTVWIDDLYFYQEVADCSLCGFHRH